MKATSQTYAQEIILHRIAMRQNGSYNNNIRDYHGDYYDEY